MAWSATQYLKFEDQRTRPVRDLMSAVPTADAHAVMDIGCGPANSTQVLAERYPDARISGFDSDPDMIAAARQRLPDGDFTLSSLDDWAPETRYDVILSNAVLHWIPDHAALLPRLASYLSPGGTLAIQMPNNLLQASHIAMCEIAGRPEWAYKLSPDMARRTPIYEPGWYFDVLQPHCSAIDIWQTTYCHHLPGGTDAIVEWFRGSALRPFLAVLDDAERARFLGQYRAAIASAYPPMKDGSVLLPFPRLFIAATR
jgi:trans-aconitate 2-methyltransferase